MNNNKTSNFTKNTQKSYGKNDIPAETYKNFKTIFKQIDTNGNNLIGKNELIFALKKLKLSHNAKNIDDLFNEIDEDKSGSINFSEFVNFAFSRELDIIKIFKKLDKKKEGYISSNSISYALDEIGMDYTSEEIKSFVNKIDINKDGRITLDEFRNFIMFLPSINISAIWNSHCIHFGIDIGENLSIPDEINKLKSWKLLLSGAIAGAVSRTVTAPADRLKIIYQSGISTKITTSRSIKISIFNLCKNIIKEGGWKSFYQGNGINVLKIAPETAIKFFSYEQLKKVICKDHKHPELIERFISGAGAGIISSTCIFPMEVIKTHLALACSRDRLNIINCVKNIYRKDRIKGLYRGLSVSLLGIIPYSGIDLSLYNTLREYYKRRYPDTNPNTLIVLSSGAFSTICGQVIAYPFSCIKTKLQAQNMSGVNFKYCGMLDCFTQTIKNEGIRGLYRGILPNLIKAVPAISISYAVYENVKRGLGEIKIN